VRARPKIVITLTSLTVLIWDNVLFLFSWFCCLWCMKALFLFRTLAKFCTVLITDNIHEFTSENIPFICWKFRTRRRSTMMHWSWTCLAIGKQKTMCRQPLSMLVLSLCFWCIFVIVEHITLCHQYKQRVNVCLVFVSTVIFTRESSYCFSAS